jgi:glycine dehydrogenase subunit 2
MKYNPKLCDATAFRPGLANVHPAAPVAHIQGWLELLVDLERDLCQITGMAAATLQPPAGAAGELTGLLLVRAWHRDHPPAAGQRPRTRVLIPDSAHGTNPASVSLGGYHVTQVPSDARGLVDVAALRDRLDVDVAAIMLTNPNTLGLFEEDIVEMAAAVHEVGGLVYYDGANLNAILGVTRPGTREVGRQGGGFGWEEPERSIGRVHGWHGNALALARAHSYMLANGGDGLRRVADAAVLNANWLRHRLRDVYDLPYDRVCMHEFVASAAGLKKRTGVKAIDVAKRLLEEGFHAPTVYFPLIVEEALMIEPSETESLQTLEALADALIRIAEAAATPEGADAAHAAPRNTPVGRVDEVRAARHLIPTWDAR